MVLRGLVRIMGQGKKRLGIDPGICYLKKLHFRIPAGILPHSVTVSEADI